MAIFFSVTTCLILKMLKRCTKAILFFVSMILIFAAFLTSVEIRYYLHADTLIMLLLAFVSGWIGRNSGRKQRMNKVKTSLKMKMVVIMILRTVKAAYPDPL